MGTQLRLFPAPQPLVARLGRDFFRTLPRTPGVYRMYDGNGRLLYVGKARDLRARIASYRRTHGQSRKTVRLIHEVERIEWEAFDTEVQARLRENLLIREHRPKFNRVGVWPRSARWLRLVETPDGWELGVSASGGSGCYGPFRGGAGMALMSLARLLHWAEGSGCAHDLLPHELSCCDTLRGWRCNSERGREWMPLVRRFLEGSGDELLGQLAQVLPEPRSGFDQAWTAVQFEVLLEFYRRGPYRGRHLRALKPEGDGEITPEDHDDLLVLWSALKSTAPLPFRPPGPEEAGAH